jgi:hypothetical protein
MWTRQDIFTSSGSGHQPNLEKRTGVGHTYGCRLWKGRFRQTRRQTDGRQASLDNAKSQQRANKEPTKGHPLRLAPGRNATHGRAAQPQLPHIAALFLQQCVIDVCVIDFDVVDTC